MKEFINQTYLEVAGEWVLEKLSAFDTSKLRLHLKHHRRKDQLFSGYYRFDDFLIVAAIHERMRFPFLLQKPIGSKPNKRRRVGYEYLWHELPITCADQAMVWVVGHECWHYLCKTKQEKGNWETRANKFGFAWAKEFAAQTGSEPSLFNWKPLLAKAKTKKMKVVYG